MLRSASHNYPAVPGGFLAGHTRCRQDCPPGNLSRHKTILFSRENIRPEPEGVATKIRVARCFAEESADTPAVLEVEVDQADVPAADEILTFASLHGEFVCISDRIFRRFEIILPPESRLEILKDALLEVVRLEPEGSEGLNPYEVEDFVDALERTRQKVLGEDERP
ncbi:MULTISPECIES: hypothetical protein [unclassified Methanoculleus]|uniref:hypothetical protein n=1 Tax=unclassified Methanoculleus TaxID=2619537 RepID=UPI0025ED22D0|nr:MULTISPECIES: hypothetical protein [unclassified Methanoculleus]